MLILVILDLSETSLGLSIIIKLPLSPIFAMISYN